MAKQCAVQCPDPFSEYLPDLQNKQPFQHSMHPGRRARLVYSWIRGACAFLNNFFLQQQCHHVISISVVDDTNMRLAAQVTGKWYSSRTVSVLNNVQTCVACFDMDPDPSHAIGETCRGYRSFPLHTPLTCLPRATARNLFQEIRSWLVCEAGSRWQQFGLKADLFDKTPFLCQVMCFDSLSTNVQLFKMLRRASFQKQQAQQAKARPDQSHLLVGTPCAIHQIALARKALLFYHPNFWSTAFFKDYMTGVFGKQLVKEYIEKLKLMPHVGIETDSLFSDYFILCLLQIGECWRRFCYNLSSFPHALWRVLGLKERELCMQLAEFQRQVSKCTVCADPEFTAVLLSQLPNVIDCENPEHVQQAVKLQQVLADLACVAPLSTDAVEPPVPPGEYAAEVRRCGKEWARVSEDVRSSFQDKAVLEQSLREEAMKQPFPSKHGKPDDLGGAAFDAVSELCPKAVKKISQPRLVQTYNRYSHSDMWSTSSMGLASADGCLRLDLIDTETPDKDIQSHMATAFHNPAPACESDIEEELPGCHHETCWEAFGHCQRKIHAVLARKFVRSLKYFLTNGISPAIAGQFGNDF
ncbi:unnamed protein product [Durusdinium trenchii]|uniref:Uncharacterized protein n=1 Tax=Durusdinium trenchii TaxID=1381693 RepID=A0ABP0H7K2_9DINO